MLRYRWSTRALSSVGAIIIVVGIRVGTTGGSSFCSCALIRILSDSMAR